MTNRRSYTTCCLQKELHNVANCMIPIELEYSNTQQSIYSKFSGFSCMELTSSVQLYRCHSFFFFNFILHDMIKRKANFVIWFASERYA
uniref:Uncharacterized protein n=1 Tax=Oryza brachyantha TaxID=4533 RepID=J3N8E9_ORYBR